MTMLAWGSGASASAEPGPAWRLKVTSVPTNVAPGDTGFLLLQVENIGDAPSVTGSPITLVDRLPPGMVATQAATLHPETVSFEPTGPWGNCTITPDERTVTCTYEPGATISPVSRSQFNQLLEEGVDGSHALAPAVGIEFSVEPLVLGVLTDSASVSGGGAPEEARDVATIDTSSVPAGFGVASFHQWSTNVDGASATQAGGHPYETTTSFRVNTVGQGEKARQAGGVVRDLDVELPPGFIGDPNAVPKCPRSDFDKRLNGSYNPACPADTQIGTVRATLEANFSAQIPLYNLVPPAGIPAQFGAGFEKVVAFINAGVRARSGGEYRIVVESTDIQTDGGLQGASVSIWGDPPDSSHDALRIPLEPTTVDAPPPGVNTPSNSPLRPFLTLPTSCGAQQTLTVSAVSWADSLQTVVPFNGIAASTDEQNNPVSIGGCSKLDFSPSIEVGSGTTAAESPAGVSVSLKVPQNEDPNGLAEADLENVSVTLPAGMAVSASAANGLEACSEEQLGVAGSGSSLLFNESAARCPAGSKLGTVEVVTPLLEHPLQGALYLAKQEENPFNSLVALYLVVEGSGVLVKRAGEVHLNQQTGQITATFLNNPQVPLSEIKVDTFQNSHSSVMTPAGCGTYTTDSNMTAWNGSFATPSPAKPFAVTERCGQGFTPAFTAGTANNQAGAFSPFSVTFSRQDGEQRIADASVETPPGLSADLPNVRRCPEPQASNATCGPESQIGHATVAVGSGPEPFYAPANVFLTGPYGGAPFGLSIVARAKAGPFDLGTVIVRARVSVDPHTTQVIVTPDGSGPFAIPTILKGIPLDLRLAGITIERPGGGDFLFNPTNCSPSSVNGTLTSTTGTNTSVSSRFQATGCAKLPFKPVFTASTQAHTSKAYGASLTVKIIKKPGEANLHKVDLQLPIALPARLTTLQKACTEAQFNGNPAGCPAGSVIGTAKLITPVLGVPVTGPAILVSHGGAAFPDVEFVLQGEGVTAIVDGATDIKKGITYSKFETAPDQPFSSFETRLPEGPYSVLATDIPATAKGNLCAQTLTMPTTLTGQSGAVVSQTTKIAVSGCPKVKKKAKPKKKKRSKSTRRAGK
jgi:hypothetical protein